MQQVHTPVFVMKQFTVTMTFFSTITTTMFSPMSRWRSLLPNGPYILLVLLTLNHPWPRSSTTKRKKPRERPLEGIRDIFFARWFFLFFLYFWCRGSLGLRIMLWGSGIILPFFLRKHPNRKFCLCNETIYTQITTVTLTCP
jgi:hypothetical protein